MGTLGGGQSGEEADRTERLLLQGWRSGCREACPCWWAVLGAEWAGASASGTPPQVLLSGPRAQPLLAAPGLLPGLWAAPRPRGHGELCVLQHPGLPR